MYQYPDYLMHYGVPGMKWGQRKSKVTSGKTRKHGKSSYSKDYSETASLRKKSYKQLSNEELRKVNKRMNLESEYRRLNPKGIDRGKKIAKNLVTTVSLVGSVYALRKAPITQLGASIINLKIRKQKQLPAYKN